MVGKAFKQTFGQAFIGIILSGVLAGLMGCTSVSPMFEPAPPAKHRKVVRVAPQPKVVRYNKATTGKVIKPAEETPQKPPVIPSLGGSGGGGGAGGGGGGWG
ncbi:hypothetical protein ACYG9R_01385 [Mesorhizobium sp. RSR565B]|uniref:hypothetical protein n=1 Tax=unclassified Mesorhizobium TaxID=325217 RepID=UPI0003CFFEA7|nr:MULTISPECIES: hypothetical protein [unclassified Mesorhizobium]ESZ46630.1 hypothetical protein X730_19025 [Mesorhizobium sp. L103C565B0]ESZ55425.1 hypothetical protein X729_26310 [Mesorhizobium sp. L103C131B0]